MIALEAVLACELHVDNDGRLDQTPECKRNFFAICYMQVTCSCSVKADDMI